MREIRLEKKGELWVLTIHRFGIERLMVLSRCTFFQWAKFDEDGEPPWAKKGS